MPDNSNAMDGDGRFPVHFFNVAQDALSSDDIYIYALGTNADGHYCYVKADGTMLPMNPSDADAPGHLTKNGVNYAAYAFRLSDASAFQMPNDIRGGRFYISVGSPLYIALFDNGYAGPDPENPSDPNIDIVYGLFEFTWAFNEVAFGCNLSAVNSFGLPFSMRLVRDWDHYDKTSGIKMKRADIFNQFKKSVNEIFKPLAGKYLILAPYTLFRNSNSGKDYFYQVIDDFWKYYKANPFEYTFDGNLVQGQVINNSFKYNITAADNKNTDNKTTNISQDFDYAIGRPSTYDVMAGANTLATGSDIEKKFQAQLCAAFNRGVALDPSKWMDASAYYPPGVAANDYARFFHSVSIDGLAYGFGYDDVNNQSGVQILSDPGHPPTSLTLLIGC